MFVTLSVSGTNVHQSLQLFVRISDIVFNITILNVLERE